MSITREQLYRLVCEIPQQHLARQLGVSNSYLARVCTALDVPRPPRGWWAKRAVGTAPPLPPLSAPRPGHPTEWSRKGVGTGPIFQFHRRRRLWASARSIGMHPLAAYAVEVFGAAEANGGSDVLRTRAKQAIDLTVSKDVVDQAIACANAIFMALEQRGHAVEVAARRGFIRPAMDGRDGPATHAREFREPDWTPLWPTVAAIAGTPVGLAILEIQELVDMQYVGDGNFVRVSGPARQGAHPVVGITWQEKRWTPTGRLKLVAYSPVFSVSWRSEWPLRDLEHDVEELAGIIAELERSAATLSAPYAQAVLPRPDTS